MVNPTSFGLSKYLKLLLKLVIKEKPAYKEEFQVNDILVSFMKAMTVDYQGVERKIRRRTNLQQFKIIGNGNFLSSTSTEVMKSYKYRNSKNWKKISNN